MGKANCPFYNSQNTFNIAYGYLGENKDKKNYIDQHDIGKNIKNKYGYLKHTILNNINKLKDNEIIWDDELGWFKELDDEIEEEIEI